MSGAASLIVVEGPQVIWSAVLLVLTAAAVVVGWRPVGELLRRQERMYEEVLQRRAPRARC